MCIIGSCRLQVIHTVIPAQEHPYPVGAVNAYFVIVLCAGRDKVARFIVIEFVITHYSIRYAIVELFIENAADAVPAVIPVQCNANVLSMRG